jgi:hypothetical protein
MTRPRSSAPRAGHAGLAFLALGAFVPACGARPATQRVDAAGGATGAAQDPAAADPPIPSNPAASGDAGGTAPAPGAKVSPLVTFADGKKPTREIHVSPSAGEDGDGSRRKPLRNLRDAVGAATPGTRVVLHEGRYGYFWLQEVYGTAEAPIWIGGAPGEKRPVFSDRSGGLHIARARYLVVHDLELSGIPDGGLNADDDGHDQDPTAAHHIVFQNLYIHDIGGNGNQDCLKLSGLNDFFVIGSRFERCGGQGGGSGIDMVGCHRGVVADNVIMATGGSGVQVKGGSEDVLVLGNRIVDGGPRPINLGGRTSLQYFRPPLKKGQDNVAARRIHAIGNTIVRGTTGVAFVGCVDCLVANNTIIEPESWAFRILQENTAEDGFTFAPAARGRFVNNLVWFAGGRWRGASNVGPDTAPGTFVIAGNWWYAYDGKGAAPALPVTETAGVVGRDPKLHAPPDDPRICDPKSPALGAGQVVPEVVATGRYAAPVPVGAFAGPPCP